MQKDKRRYTRIRIEAQKLNKWKCKSKMNYFILKIWINWMWMYALIFQNFAWVSPIFFIIYLAALSRTLGHLAGSLTHPISLFCCAFDPKVTKTSQQGWVPKPSRYHSKIRTGSLPNLIQHLTHCANQNVFCAYSFWNLRFQDGITITKKIVEENPNAHRN